MGLLRPHNAGNITFMMGGGGSSSGGFSGGSANPDHEPTKKAQPIKSNILVTFG
jgi:hypothetical protein